MRHARTAAAELRPSAALFWSLTADGAVLWVRVTPRARRDALEGLEHLADGRAVLKARLRAAPVEGEANAALCRLIADALAVPRRHVQLSSGLAGRLKRVAVTGDVAALGAALGRLAQAGFGHDRKAFASTASNSSS